MKKRNSKQLYLGENLIFMVGSPRSGTTWLQRMLIASSSRIKTGPETFIFNHFIGPQMDKWNENEKSDAHSLRHSIDREEFISALRMYTTMLMSPILKTLTSDEFLLEKSNSHALVLPLVREIFPKSKIIYVLRDPRDVVASWLAAARTWGNDNKNHTAAEFARHWKNSYLTAQELHKNDPKELFYLLRYEDLLTDTSNNLKQLLKFLNISIPQTKIQNITNTHTIDNMRDGKGYKKILLKGQFGGTRGKEWNEPQGYFRKGKIGSWKQDLNLIEKYQVYKETKSLMHELGYI